MTIADRITEKLRPGPATLADLDLQGVSDSTLQRTVIRMCHRGDIRVVGTEPKPPGKRGRSRYLYAVRA